MKFTAVLAFVAAATVVSASTNAERFARGLGPKAPGLRGSRVADAHQGKPSGTPGKRCNTGPMHCCNSVQKAHGGGSADEIMKALGILGNVQPGTSVGVTCSPITGVGAGSGAHCTQQTVCCDNNSFNGLVNIGCSPITINL